MLGVKFSDMLLAQDDERSLTEMAASAAETKLPQMRPFDFKMRLRFEVFIVDARDAVAERQLYRLGIRQLQAPGHECGETAPPRHCPAPEDVVPSSTDNAVTALSTPRHCLRRSAQTPSRATSWR